MVRSAVVLVTGALLAAVLVLGTIDTLVWLPQLTAPGIPLGRVYEALSASGDLPSVLVGAIGWLGIWTLLSALFVTLMLPVRPAFRPLPDGAGTLGVVAIACLLLGAVGFLHWWSAFAMGMSVSDELPPGTGRTTALGAALLLGGLLVGAVGVVLGVVALVAGARSRPAVTA